MEAYDAIVIGAGHNGLVCAAYLLNAGYSVLLLEKRPVPGGAATTEEAIPEEAPGFKFNLCAIDHEFIFLGPIIEELQLQKYGLEYLACDPHTFCPHPDGKYFLAHKSLEKTHNAIARYSARDADKYVEFIGYWSKLMSAIAPFFNAPPQSVLGIAQGYKKDNILDALAIAGSKDKALNFIRTMITAPEDLLNEYFDTELVKAPLARLAAEIGAPPSQKGITAGLMMLAMRHHPGMARPKGGTGALTQALVKLVTAKGGKILTEQMVKEVIVEDNRAVGVKVAGGAEYRANRAVISNIDVRRLFLQLVAEDAINPNLREKVDRRITNNNETILKIDCALSEAPRFTAYDRDDEENLIGTVLIADSTAHVEQAHSLATMGQIPDANPSIYLDIPSVLDPTLAPEGKHTLWIEFFAPYQIAGKEGTGLYGTGWTDELKNQVADNVMNKLADYAPNIKDSVIARRVESPAELGERLGSYKGNYYHLDMTLDQMIFLRPLPEIANYTTPIKNLYLTGAGTHPGGSISGMPGRNCARVFLNKQQPLAKAQESVSAILRSLLDLEK
ncbi:NAD(P)/FAD-dependent oxidoreductase [Waterburya agarophytonicola K14]|uniref:NAD(P)/FAD-dependent oxidoreductase n=1 Tax=Waterburya agarophytonicola KI4 TaxID=2874699 RepID=A0A964BSI4_9CYAN|nr:NAD(P)/FAD-dependent oxidoreductase [Waterburya agarophytonicola]MCC0177698.1 NAD(P)/FAD-dependent oxidoreductase [Waterburya agarophytonicola KI4]